MRIGRIDFQKLAQAGRLARDGRPLRLHHQNLHARSATGRFQLNDDRTLCGQPEPCATLSSRS